MDNNDTSSQQEGRFPRPDFESAYQLPVERHPAATLFNTGYVPLVILFIMLCLATYFALKKHSRKMIFLLSLFSLAYFGFYRKGCICVVGSLQNVVAACFDPTYAIPFMLVLFFLMPLVFTLFFGRTFCSSVCPLGAIQDVVIIKPIKVPAYIEHSLGLLPYLFFGFAVLFAATGCGFIICKTDPYIVFFRMYGKYQLVIFGIAMLLLGTFIARPYCRYICPYSVLLRWTSFFSKYHYSITDQECIQCRLCEKNCPFGAIEKPFPEKIPESSEHGKRTLLRLILILPIMILIFGWCFSRLDGRLSRLHPTVALAEQIRTEDLGRSEEPTWETVAFRASGKPKKELYSDAVRIRRKFYIGGWLLGAFLGMILSCKLISLSTRKGNKEYQPDRMKCLSCGRCYKYCPLNNR